MKRRSARTIMTVIAALSLPIAIAGPASASPQLVYGTYISGTCPNAGAATKCTVTIKYNGVTTTTSPSAVGGVLCPGNAADGMPVYSAVVSKSLVNKYVAVQWDSSATVKTGQITCH